MNALSTFNFNDTAAIRVVTLNGDPWFVSKDACSVLYNPDHIATYGPAQYTQHLDANERRVIKRREGLCSDLFTGQRKAHAYSLVSESGLYKLIMRSDKPQAKPFQNWVTQVVLPAIRKDGGYILGEERAASGEWSEDELIFRAMEVMRRKMDRLSTENAAMEKELNEVTVDEYRALGHHYWPHGFKVRMGQRAKTVCELRGVAVQRQTRQVRYDGKTHETIVNVYPRDVLDAVFRELSPLLEIA